MIELPSTTSVGKRLPKDAFYNHLKLTKVLRDKFVSDVEKIVVENTLTNDSLNLSADSEIKEIMLLSITLKKQEFDGKVIEAIARQNQHELVFLLIYEDKRQLAIYHSKLYRTPWLNADAVSLKINGYDLDSIRNSFIEQIALYEEQAENTDSLSVDERLELKEKREKLQKEIEKLRVKIRKEKQFNRQVELNKQLKALLKQLEEL